jgi:hypothetical protein
MEILPRSKEFNGTVALYVTPNARVERPPSGEAARVAFADERLQLSGDAPSVTSSPVSNR